MRSDPGKPEGSESLDGILERVVYSNEQTAWTVVRLTVPDRAAPVTAVGNLLGVQEGESLRLRGKWVEDKRYGQQFRVDAYMTLQPSTLLGIERYLGSGLVPGIGRAMAKRLIDRFGLETLEVIEQRPERLTEVEGIGRVRSERICEAWREQRRIKEVMVFLQSCGVSSAFAVRIYKKYGDRAIAVVRSNPYRLASDIYGIGFRSADKIAADLGIARDAPQRVEAGVLHTLAELAEEGHVYAPREALRQAAAAVLEVDESLVEQAIGSLADERELVLEPTTDGEAVFLRMLHAAERGAAERLRTLLATEPAAPAIDATRAIRWVETQRHITLAAQQREALRRGLQSKLLVITGGPGTGKTTIIAGLIDISTAQGWRVLCCAPTGRAAKRMQEATGHEAKTIHRLLEYAPKAQAFERDEDHPLEVDLLVVDELSMVDILLLNQLVKALPPTCRLVLVGDADQLPSVGPGAVLRDLLRSGAVDVVVLAEIFRQAEQSLIVVNAHRVNRGELPLAEEEGAPRREALRDFYVIERAEPEAALATLKELVATRIPERFGVHAVDEIQVLTPMHKGTLGAINLNAELQALLNPQAEELSRGGRTYRVGDKVMQVRNNYDLDVYNGDIGRITGVDREQREVRVRFEGREVVYPLADADELVLAYACSIHKAQGSEYPVVLLPLHTQHFAMLQRNLLYTALTRGKRLVIIVGSRRALALAVANNRAVVRHTRLAERLADGGTWVDPNS